MRRSTEFCSGILGFEKVFEIPDDKGNPWICYFKIGRSQFIELFYPQKEAAPDAVSWIGFSHMCFLVDDIKSTEADIVKRGGTLDRPIKVGKVGNFQCWVKDPAATESSSCGSCPNLPTRKARCDHEDRQTMEPRHEADVGLDIMGISP